MAITIPEPLQRAMERGLCVPPDTIIPGDFKSIAEYETGDYTLEGKVVERTFERDFDGKLVSINAVGLLPVKTTPEHPIKTVSVESGSKRVDGEVRHVREHSEARFKEASQVKPIQRENWKIKGGDYLVIPRLEGDLDKRNVDLSSWIKPQRWGEETIMEKSATTKLDEFPINKDTAFLLGLYVADGYSNKGHCITFSLPSGDQGLVEKAIEKIEKLGYSARTHEKEEEDCTEVKFSSRILSRAFSDWCGNNSSEKRVPEFIFRHVEGKVVESFLDGYIAGDGGKANNGWIKADTVSKPLALAVQLMFIRLGYICRIYETEQPTEHVIEERTVNQEPVKYQMMIKKNVSSHSQMKVFDDYVLTPVKSVNKEKYEGKVHNLETKNSTYLVSNAVVHNCQYVHDTMILQVPPTPPEGIRQVIKPKKGEYCRRAFSMVLGEMSPGPPTSDFYITHWSRDMIEHDDPWVHSLIDEAYPLYITITHRNHHTFVIHNNTGETQTVDVTFHYMVFETEEDWNQYRALVEERHSILEVVRDIRDMMDWVKEIPTKIKEALKEVRLR